MVSFIIFFVLFSVHLVGKYDGKVCDERDVQFNLGEGEDLDIIDGVEIALKSFKMGEKSRLKIKSKHAFKDAGFSKFNIPPNADLEYIVELKNFEKVNFSRKYFCLLFITNNFDF